MAAALEMGGYEKLYSLDINGAGLSKAGAERLLAALKRGACPRLGSLTLGYGINKEWWKKELEGRGPSLWIY